MNAAFSHPYQPFDRGKKEMNWEKQEQQEIIEERVL